MFIVVLIRETLPRTLAYSYGPYETAEEAESRRRECHLNMVLSGVSPRWFQTYVSEVEGMTS